MPSPTGLPSKRCPGIGFISRADGEIGVVLKQRAFKDESEVSPVRLFVTSWTVALDCGPPGSFVYGILQARTLEWVAILLSRGSS